MKSRLYNLDLTTLRSFATIAETGSMTKASARLYMTQSAISMQIKRLEETLGFKVFDRGSQGLATTQEGEQLLQYAQQMLSLNDEVMGRLTSPDYEGQIRLGVPFDMVHPLIPQVLKTFKRDYPRVDVQLSVSVTRDLLDAYENGGLDIVLTTEKTVSEGGLMLKNLKMQWMGAEGGVAWKKRPLPLGISKNCAFRSTATAALDAAGIHWIDVVATEDATAAAVMIAADLCVGVELENYQLPGQVAQQHNGQLPDLPYFAIGLYHHNKGASGINDILVEQIVRAFA